MKTAIGVATALVVLGFAARAHAQECLHTARSTSSLAMRAGIAVEAGAIDDDLGRSGHYRGTVASLELAALGGRARVALGAYQVDWGQTGQGLGDLQLGVERAVADLGNTKLGLALSATLPTGNVRHDLGMGHAMLMPTAWARWHRDRSSLLAMLLYGTMLGDQHVHGMAGPIPSPMNAEEVATAVRGGRTFGRTELSATISGATPIGEGSTRGGVGAGARWTFGSTELAVDATAAFGGTPLQARGVVEISRGF
jgi:hypothetical protein